MGHSKPIGYSYCPRCRKFWDSQKLIQKSESIVLVWLCGDVFCEESVQFLSPEQVVNKLNNNIEMKATMRKMAEAIEAWEQAKKEREEWKPVPGHVPPVKYFEDAKKANVMLSSALDEYKELVKV